MKKILCVLLSLLMVPFLTGANVVYLLGLDNTAAAGGIAFRSQTTYDIATNDSITITKPSGTVANDVMVAFITSDGVECTFTIPSGWTEVSHQYNTGPDTNDTGIFIKRAGDSEPSNYTFSTGKTTIRTMGAILCYSGVSTTTALDVDPPTKTANNSPNASPVTVTATGLTTVTNNAMVLYLGSMDSNSATATATFAEPSGWTKRVEGSNGNWLSIGVAELVVVSAGATGNISGVFTLSTANAGYAAFLVALRPQ